MKKQKLNSRLKQLRLLLNKSQLEFAEELDTTQANISQIEHEVCVPAGNFLNKLAERFPEINFNWLILGEGTPLRRDDKHTVRVDKKFLRDFEDLNQKVARLEIDNSNLIKLAGIKKGK